MSQTPAGATIPEVTHHTSTLNGDELHYVTAGTDGTPILLVHGFPESWWAFHKLIPLDRRGAPRHRCRPPRLRRLRHTSRATTRAPSQRKACGN